MNLISIPAFQDNYIWVLSQTDGKCLIVDPGEAAPVFEAINQFNLTPQAILLTHHHHDHVGGVAEIVKKYPSMTVYGPQETVDKGANFLVDDGDKIKLLGHEFTVIATPGHTLEHICYFSFPYLFCGDTLFSGGCGRLFEGTANQMYQSLMKLNILPAETLVCSAHEYTLSNLTFALSLFPCIHELQEYYIKVKELREKNRPSLPSTLEIERKVNIFLRTQDNEINEIIDKNIQLPQPQDRFAWLRASKDKF